MIDDKLSQFKCGVCYQDYNEQQRTPMIICPNSHMICYTCTSILSKKGRFIYYCPFCKLKVSTKEIPFKKLLEFKETYCQQRQQKQNIISQLEQQLDQNIAEISALHKYLDQNQSVMAAMQKQNEQLRQQKQISNDIISLMQKRIAQLSLQVDKLQDLQQKSQNIQYRQKIQISYQQHKVRKLQQQNLKYKLRINELQKTEQPQKRQMQVKTNLNTVEKHINKQQQKTTLGMNYTLQCWSKSKKDKNCNLLEGQINLIKLKGKY